MRRLLALGLVVAALVLPACDLFGGDPEPSLPPSVPAAGDRSPAPGQPPIVWVGGLLQEIAETRLTVLGASEDPAVLQRLAGGATRFLVADGDTWRELGEDETSGISVGRRVCAEVLLDGSNLVALRVFLDAECGPTGAAP